MYLPPAIQQKLGSAASRLFDRGQAVVDRMDRNLPTADTLGDVRRPMVIGAVVILITFFGFGLWAAVAPLGSAAMAPGVVVAEGSRRVVQHLEGGIVRDILVDEGQMVHEGDVLIRMDDTRAKASLAIVQADLDLQRAVRARLVAERDTLKEPKFPPELLTRIGDATVGSIIAGQTNLFAARRASLQGQHDILEQRIGQYAQQIAGLRAQVTSKTQQIALIKEELSDLSGLLEDGYVTKTRVLALKREAARLEGELGDHLANIARSEQGIGENKMQMLQVEKQHQEEVAKELRDVEARIAEDAEKQIASVDVMKRIDVLAPVSGTVLNLQLHTPGGVVSPGASLMEIVPANDKLVVEAQVNPLDIDTVKSGDEVALHVSTVGARLLPTIYGTLETLSADRITDPRTGHAYYKAKIIIPADQMDRLGDVKLQDGMAVEAMISRGSQTALHYAVKPLLESLTRSFREK